ncbi:MAG: hypothetical protein U0L88_11660 [Acutalibacteraceae bacterium]|nr:hypothetical protein [Acutalibacteraceae bacterium]
MGRNKNSEVGAGEDLLRAIVQMGAAEIHAMGLYYKTTAEMENGLVDIDDNEVLQKYLDKANMYLEDIETYAVLRRRMTTALKEMVGTENADKDLWCMVKHLGLSMMQCFEAYENSDNNLELLNLAYEANKAFTKAVTRFLGIEVTECSACLSDSLKGVNHE